MSRILAASEEQPYLGLRIIIDPAVIASVMLEMGQLPAAQPDTRSGH